MSSKAKGLIVKVILVIVAVIIVHVTWQRNYGSLEKRYVVGEVERIIPAWGQDPKVEFSFRIYGNKYDKASPRSIYHPKKGELYIVEVPIKNIKKSKILLDIPVYDSIKSPWEGWDKIPEFLKTK